MSSVFRESPGRVGQNIYGRLSGGALIKYRTGNVAQLIANEFWTKTTNPNKLISLTIKDSTGALVANSAVKYSIHSYASGNPYNSNFMNIISKGVGTTNGSGVLEVLYLGTESTAYVSVINSNASPAESMIWTVTVT
jgi:fibrillarin-like rRNA methylase